jgi:hypothetical protein
MQRTILALVIVCLATNPIVAQSINADRPSIRIRLTGASGERVTGRAHAIEGGVLEFVRDGAGGKITLVQLDSIRLIERGSRRAPRPVAIAAGAGLGVVGMITALFAGFASCSHGITDSRCGNLYGALAYIGAPVMGTLFGWYLGRMNWTPIGADELEKMLERLRSESRRKDGSPIHAQ